MQGQIGEPLLCGAADMPALPNVPHPFDYAVAIGRFQPVHCGHVALLQACLRVAPRLIVLVGSVNQPRSRKNPFTFEERRTMLHAALPPEQQKRLQVAGVEDHPDDAVWVGNAHAAVNAALAENGDDAASARIALVGHEKDASSYYLRIFPHWQFVPFANVAGLDGTAIRASYLAEPQAAQPLWLQHGILPASSRLFLQQHRAALLALDL